MLFPPPFLPRSTKCLQFAISLIFLFEFPNPCPSFSVNYPPKRDKLRQKRFGEEGGIIPLVKMTNSALTGNKWPKTEFGWKLHSDNLEEMDIFIIRNILHRAFGLWEEASNSMLNFREAGKGEADMNIHFLVGEHGDGMPFDGPEGKIAHAFYPPIGELHLDAEEKWTLNRAEGTNLFQTFVHEIGHLLGIGHSKDPQAVMFPIKRKFEGRIELAKDDLEAIRELYKK